MKLFYREMGKGAPIILLHGFLGTSDNWISIARKLQEDFRVILVDQRNHGLSPHHPEQSLMLMAEDLRELIVDLGLEDPILLGHSMGGKVIMQYSANYRDQFDRLIVVDIAPKAYPPHHQKIFDGLFSIDLNKIDSRQEADEQLANYVEEEGVRQFLLKNLNRSNQGFSWKANLKVLEASQEKAGMEIMGSNISKRPVYFIKGADSNYILQEDRARIKELYPLAKIVTIKGTGHWVHAEQPKAFLETLVQLLKG